MTKEVLHLFYKIKKEEIILLYSESDLNHTRYPYRHYCL